MWLFCFCLFWSFRRLLKVRNVVVKSYLLVMNGGGGFGFIFGFFCFCNKGVFLFVLGWIEIDGVENFKLFVILCELV